MGTGLALITEPTPFKPDISLFPNANPRNFTQIEPGQKDERSREDKLRSSPKLNLENFKKHIIDLNLVKDIVVVTE